VGGRRRAAPPPRSWQERIDDPDEPLYTMAVAADLLDLDNQTLRRLGDTISQRSARPSGNQRRYSRHDLEALAQAAELTKQRYGGAALARILELERQVQALSDTTTLVGKSP